MIRFSLILLFFGILGVTRPCNAQIPTHRLAGGDTLYDYDFSKPQTTRILRKKENENIHTLAHTVREPTLSIYKKGIHLFYEQNDTIFSALGQAIFELNSIKKMGLDSVKSDRALSKPAPRQVQEYFIISDPYKLGNSIILYRDFRLGTLHKFVLPDTATGWLSWADLKHQRIDSLFLLGMTATRYKGNGAWVLAYNNEYVYTLKLNNDMLSLVHTADSLPSEWGMWEYYSDIQFNNNGNQLAVGSFNIQYEGAYYFAGRKTRVCLYNFDGNTGTLLFDKVAKEITTFNGGLPTKGIYSLSSPKVLYWSYENTRSPAFGSLFMNLCYASSDSVLYASSGGIAPFSESDMRYYRLPGQSLYNEIMAIDLFTLEHKVVRLLNYSMAYQLTLQANGQIWINDYEISQIVYPDDVFKSGTLALSALFRDPYEYGEKKSTFIDGLFAAKKLDFRLVDTCSVSPIFTISADTAFFERFGLVQGYDTILFTSEALRTSAKIVCSTFLFAKDTIQLLGYKNNNLVQSIAHIIDISLHNKQPSAHFIVRDTLGCQWISYDFINSSKIIKKDKPIHYYWNFGNETRIHEIDPPANQIIKKTYNTSGLYNVSMTLDDGYCMDSFTLQNKVTILTAPQPGILIHDSAGCEPFDIQVNRKHTADVIDSISYTWGDGIKMTCDINCKPLNHTYKLGASDSFPKQFKITQWLYGPTGCVTSDSTIITVKPSFPLNLSPYLSNVTVSSHSSLLATWLKVPKVTHYEIYANGKMTDTTSATTYKLLKDKISLVRNDIHINAVNTCNVSSAKSNIANNIVVTSSSSSNNEFVLLKWNPYQNWADDVAQYEVQYMTSLGDFRNIISLDGASETTFQDNDFLSLQAFNTETLLTEKCYRIVATENKTGLKSESNIVCTSYKPIIFIPNSFSPNGDGINDIFHIKSLGFATISITIYTTWGEEIYTGNSSWNGEYKGKEVPAGQYLVLISATTTEHKTVHDKVMITLLR